MLAFNKKLPTSLKCFYKRLWGCSSVGRGKLLCSAADLSTEKNPKRDCGVVAQLVEHLLCKQGVVSSSLISSTTVSMKLKRQERHPLRQPSPSRQFESDQLHHSFDEVEKTRETPASATITVSSVRV